MKQSSAVKEEAHWAVTTPEDRAKIQQKISETIREAKSRPDPLSSPAGGEEDGSRLRSFSESWSGRAGNLSRKAAQRVQELSSAAKGKVRPDPDAEIWKGLAAGMAAGLIGTLVMSGFMGLWNKGGELVEEEFEDRPAKQQKQAGGEEEPSTEKVAADISEKILQRELEGETRKVAGNAVHYGFGALIGGVYGALAELYPTLTTGHGTLYGTAVWLGADELALPALGYTPPSKERPANEHVYGAAAHAVYGVVTETVRGGLRDWLG